MRSISDLIDEFEASRNVGRDPRVGPSDYGSCPRQVAYRVRGHVPGETIQKTRAATMGTLFWQGLGEFIAATYPDAVVEQKIDVPGLERPGSIDLRWRLDGVLVDVKTVSERAFDRVVTYGAKPENVGQLETYALAENRRLNGGRAFIEQAEPITRLVLAYVNRDNGACHEVEWAYDEATARAKVSTLVQLEEAIDAGFEIDRAPGARLGSFPCDWCPFWRECWGITTDEAPDDYAAKFTDTDEKVEDAIERYLTLGVVESEAKKARAVARDQLVGIDYKAGGYVLSWSSGRVTYEDQVDLPALVEAAQLAGLEIPMQTVEKRAARRINARRAAS